MKTPQQIRNEVEKKMKKLQTTQPDVIININDLHWTEREAIKIREYKAQLSILTEYDKSIKEMIEKELNKLNKDFARYDKECLESIRTDKKQYEYSERQRAKTLYAIDELNLILSKIGDNSEVEK